MGKPPDTSKGKQSEARFLLLGVRVLRVPVSAWFKGTPKWKDRICVYNIYLGVPQNSRARVTQVLVFSYIYQGAILVHVLEPQLYMYIYRYIYIYCRRVPLFRPKPL